MFRLLRNLSSSLVLALILGIGCTKDPPVLGHLYFEGDDLIGEINQKSVLTQLELKAEIDGAADSMTLTMLRWLHHAEENEVLDLPHLWIVTPMNDTALLFISDQAYKDLLESSDQGYFDCFALKQDSQRVEIRGYFKEISFENLEAYKTDNEISFQKVEGKTLGDCYSLGKM